MVAEAGAPHTARSVPKTVAGVVAILVVGPILLLAAGVGWAWLMFDEAVPTPTTGKDGAIIANSGDPCGVPGAVYFVQQSDGQTTKLKCGR